MTEAEARDVVLNALAHSNVLNAAQHERYSRDPESDVELAALGIDSMAAINFCVALEVVLLRDVEIEELVEHPSLTLLARHLALRSSQKGSDA